MAALAPREGGFVRFCLGWDLDYGVAVAYGRRLGEHIRTYPRDLS